MPDPMREAEVTARFKTEVIADILAQISSNPRLSPSVLENAPWQRTQVPRTDFEKRLERLEEWRAQLETHKPQTTSDQKLAATALGVPDSTGTPVPLAAGASSRPLPAVDENSKGKLRAIALEPSVWDSSLLIGMDRHDTLACSAWALMVLLLNFLVQARIHACSNVSPSCRPEKKIPQPNKCEPLPLGALFTGPSVLPAVCMPARLSDLPAHVHACARVLHIHLSNARLCTHVQGFFAHTCPLHISARVHGSSHTCVHTHVCTRCRASSHTLS